MAQNSLLDSEDSSSSGLDDCLYKDLPKRSTIRTRKKPTRFGVGNKNDDVTSTDDEEDFINSEEEKEYVPPTKKSKRELMNTQATIVPSSQKDVSATNSTGSKMHALDGGNDTAFLELTSVNILTDWNFNKQFDSLTEEIAIDSTACEDNAKSVHEVTSNVESGNKIIHGSAEHCVTFENNASSEQRINLYLDDTSGANSACKCNLKILEEKLDMVNSKLTELLARQTVFEEAFLKRGEFNEPAVEKGRLVLTEVNSNDRKIKEFMNTNNLPSTQLDFIKEFEMKLGEQEFVSSVKAILLLAAETNIDTKSMSTSRILRFHLYKIIDRKFLCEFTWTGKTGKAGARKIPLKEFPQTVDLVYVLTAHGRPDYTKSNFHKDLVDKVLKFAYELPLSFKNCQTITQPATVHVPSKTLPPENILTEASTSQKPAHSIGKILDFPWNK